ncbi:hypothetical protein C1E24_09510 [Pseudoalteromonas phenolica]|uniref:Uncharacterized protein n=1 Tax=Pseudoalteromonas phenolica TaxID=161398 RepID=A0A5R9Q289_9GAMM|nr:hypothetical protein [Pseudoalteromonas phenolica]TLX47035.1 hypothetical protein C1E24_09510 [Pseudoalteromonas phenolica]
MNNKFLLIILPILLLLSACTEQQKLSSFKEVQAQLKNINAVLLTKSKHELSEELPFSEAYLKQRHIVLNSADLQSFTEHQVNELQYLIIQERYPERYLPWPAAINVASNLSEGQKPAWQSLVKARLEDAKQSKILYNRYELKRLKTYSESESLTDLTDYFKTYKPRSRLGIYQLPNGKEWYQSKVNHYLGNVENPQVVLANLQALTNEYDNQENDLEALSLVKIAKKHCSIIGGLNWEHEFVNLHETFEQCEKQKLVAYKQVILVLAEIDLGIHFQAWSEEQAMVVLNQKLSLQPEQAMDFLDYIIMKPAAVLSLARVYF